jgi:hypothetical protein
VGLCWRKSGTGELVIFYVYASGDNRSEQYCGVGKLSSPTVFTSNYLSVYFASLMGYGPCLWLRIADDGTNRVCSYSADGQNFVTVHSVGRTDFLTADEVGFFADANNASYPAGLTLLSWKEA